MKIYWFHYTIFRDHAKVAPGKVTIFQDAGCHFSIILEYVITESVKSCVNYETAYEVL